jgi:ribosomal protein S18 acetylase RimI-like enzyme
MRTLVSSALNVRRFRPDDGAFVRSLAGRAFAEYDPGARRSVMRLTHSGITLVVCRGDEPLGFAIVHSADGVRADLCAIAVEEQARGLGIGRFLLEQIEAAASREGASELVLHTAEANVAALEMFLKHGFAQVARRPRYYRGVYDACTLSKRLTLERK